MRSFTYLFFLCLSMPCSVFYLSHISVNHQQPNHPNHKENQQLSSSKRIVVYRESYADRPPEKTNERKEGELFEIEFFHNFSFKSYLLSPDRSFPFLFQLPNPIPSIVPSQHSSPKRFLPHSQTWAIDPF